MFYSVMSAITFGDDGHWGSFLSKHKGLTSKQIEAVISLLEWFKSRANVKGDQVDIDRALASWQRLAHEKGSNKNGS